MLSFIIHSCTAMDSEATKPIQYCIFPPLESVRRWLPSSSQFASSPSCQQVFPALVTHPERGLVESHCFDGIAVAVVPLCGWAVLHAVVAVPYVLEKVDLQKMGSSN